MLRCLYIYLQNTSLQRQNILHHHPSTYLCICIGNRLSLVKVTDQFHTPGTHIIIYSCPEILISEYDLSRWNFATAQLEIIIDRVNFLAHLKWLKLAPSFGANDRLIMRRYRIWTRVVLFMSVLLHRERPSEPTRHRSWLAPQLVWILW